MELESPNPTQQRRPISGRAASLYYAGLRIAREQNHQRLREEANLPKNIERSLQLQRDRGVLLLVYGAWQHVAWTERGAGAWQQQPKRGHKRERDGSHRA